VRYIEQVTDSEDSASPPNGALPIDPLHGSHKFLDFGRVKNRVAGCKSILLNLVVY
jgi:hypothetical protein